MDPLFTSLSHAVEGEPALALAAAFAWGLASLLLSPCHLASIPLVVGFVNGEEQVSARRGITIAALFSLGLLTTIGVIGGITAAAGRMLGDLGPWANYLVALVFFGVGLSLLDIIRLGWGTPAVPRFHGRGLAAALVLGLVLAVLLVRWARRRQALTGQPFPALAAGTALALGVPLVVFLAAGAPLALARPELRGFNFAGGGALTPEFAALLGGLTLYTAAFIAETVRAGVLAVDRGQSEAAYALGLPPRRTMRLVILPQALRVIVPPLTSQFLNLTKNSSLAVAIGYPDLVSIANTTMNQTGQAIEGIAIIMAVYLTISLSISALMNWYNRRIALRGARR